MAATAINLDQWLHFYADLQEKLNDDMINSYYLCLYFNQSIHRCYDLTSPTLKSEKRSPQS
eukprot:15355458-Heterocapsa_arctica.AAC.1